MWVATASCLTISSERHLCIEYMTHQDLVLIGGGHTHVLLIRSLAMRPIPGVRVTLVSDKTLTPYSGMLPGFVAGHYSHSHTVIDLNQLCRRAGVRWIKASAMALNPDKKHVYLAKQAGVDYDLLSIDIGSTPDLTVNGAKEYAVGVKPIAKFQRRWASLLAHAGGDGADEKATVSGDWGVIGAGAGGVELVLAMAHRLRQCPNLRLHLICRGSTVLPGYPLKVISIVEQRLRDYGVTLHVDFSVVEVLEHGVISREGDTLNLTQSIWCTGALGADWLAESGLACTEKNFISVNGYLQSTSHATVFAAGDIADMFEDPRPKAGVYAVRQAPQLVENVRRWFAGKPLRKVTLQSQFLSLLSLGDREAVASRNGVSIKGRWVWRWKDFIDQRFMRQFIEMPVVSDMDGGNAPTHEDGTELLHCGGCGSKLGPDLLTQNLRQLTSPGLNESEDAASLLADDASLWQPTLGAMIVQSTDGFRSFTTDEYRFGRICVSHSLSDIYAMGATVTYAQSWVNLAFSHPRLQQRDHLRLLQGIVDALSEQGARLTGGHSTEGAERHLAIVANGEVMPGTQWLKSGMQPGDVLVLNKGLGTGIILAADMQGAASAKAVDAAYDSMMLGNHHGMLELKKVNPHAVTDVTGFGLLGHLLEMIDSSNAGSGQALTAVLTLSSIPVLAGAHALANTGWRSSLYPQLKPYLERCVLNGAVSCAVDQVKTGPAQIDVLLDPQTSGGLLAALPASQAAILLQGKSDFVVIGRIQASVGYDDRSIVIDMDE